MPPKVISALSRALWDTELVSPRILLALSEFLWAALLWWPGPTFGRPTYAGMAAVMPEPCWGFLFFVTGIAQLSIVALEAFHTTFARHFAFFNMLLWSFIVISMLRSVYPPPAAISAEISMAVAAFWIWIRPLLICNWIHHARTAVRQSQY